MSLFHGIVLAAVGLFNTQFAVQVKTSAGAAQYNDDQDNIVNIALPAGSKYGCFREPVYVDEGKTVITVSCLKDGKHAFTFSGGCRTDKEDYNVTLLTLNVSDTDKPEEVSFFIGCNTKPRKATSL